MRLLRLLAVVPKRLIVISVLAGIANGVVSGILLSAVRSATDVSADHDHQSIHFVLIVIAYAATAWLVRWLAPLVHDVPLQQLRLNMSRHILSAPLSVLERVGTGRIMTSMSDDVSIVMAGLTALPKTAMDLAIVVSCLVYIGILAPMVLAFFGVTAVTAVVFYLLLGRAAANAFTRAARLRHTIFAHITSLLHGSKELRLNRNLRRDVFVNSLQPALGELVGSSTRAARLQSGASLISMVCAWSFMGLILFYLPHVQAQTSTALLANLVLVALFLLAPIERVLDTANVLTRSNVSLRALDELGQLLDAPSALPEAQEPDPPAFSRSLELRGVTHRYYREKQDDLFVIGPIDLTIARGELLFIVGGNGSGKTTLAKLIAGLYAPESGQLLLDGEPVTESGLERYRQQFAAVFSDFHVFERLVGVSTESAEIDRSANELLERLHLQHKVIVRERSFSTLDLSLGQRKRLALASVYLQDRPICIFDEWAADQDPVFKKIFYTEILQHLKARGKTCIVVTHDDRYFHCADRIITLESGQLVASP